MDTEARSHTVVVAAGDGLAKEVHKESGSDCDRLAEDGH